MSRLQRRVHLLAWLVLGPLSIVTVLLAVRARQDVPVEDSLQQGAPVDHAPPTQDLPESLPPTREVPR